MADEQLDNLEVPSSCGTPERGGTVNDIPGRDKDKQSAPSTATGRRTCSHTGGGRSEAWSLRPSPTTDNGSGDELPSRTCHVKLNCCSMSFPCSEEETPRGAGGSSRLVVRDHRRNWDTGTAAAKRLHRTSLSAPLHHLPNPNFTDFIKRGQNRDFSADFA